MRGLSDILRGCCCPPTDENKKWWHTKINFKKLFKLTKKKKRHKQNLTSIQSVSCISILSTMKVELIFFIWTRTEKTMSEHCLSLQSVFCGFTPATWTQTMDGDRQSFLQHEVCHHQVCTWLAVCTDKYTCLLKLCNFLIPPLPSTTLYREREIVVGVCVRVPYVLCMRLSIFIRSLMRMISPN